MAHAFIDDRDGFIVVHNVDTSWSEPVEIHRVWATGIRTREFVDMYGADLIGHACKYDVDCKVFVIRRGPGNSLYVRTEGDAVIEERSVPPPKVRKSIETRWGDGRWEKYSKTKGWIPA